VMSGTCEIAPENPSFSAGSRGSKINLARWVPDRAK
jgi:hypothetical protein